MIVRSLITQKLNYRSINSSANPEMNRQMMADTLEHSTRPISEADLRHIGQGSDGGPRAIEKVIVVGDRAGERHLWMMLQGLFDAEVLDRVRDVNTNRHPPDWMSFSGALGAARIAHDWFG
jgi:hypothetical protein